MTPISASAFPSTSYWSPSFHLLLGVPFRVPPLSVQFRCVGSIVVIVQLPPVVLLRRVRFRKVFFVLSPPSDWLSKWAVVSSRLSSLLPPPCVPLADGNGSNCLRLRSKFVSAAMSSPSRSG